MATKISADIILATVPHDWEEGNRINGFVKRDLRRAIMTMECTYPRSIHAEMMTHRTFATNSASSRAIPYSQLRAAALADDEPGGSHFPIEYWGRDGAGMQAGSGIAVAKSEGDRIVKDMRDAVIEYCDELNKVGVHKSLINRYLEPFTHITVVRTGTWAWWKSFLRLRFHTAAERHLARLANQALGNLIAVGMGGDVDASQVNLRRDSDYHLPYLSEEDDSQLCSGSGSGVGVNHYYASAAKCARLSYRVSGVTGKVFTLGDDIELGVKLMNPIEKSELPFDGEQEIDVLHGSPLEHPIMSQRAFDKLFPKVNLRVRQVEESLYGDLGLRSIVSPDWVTLRQLKELGLVWPN